MTAAWTVAPMCRRTPPSEAVSQHTVALKLYCPTGMITIPSGVFVTLIPLFAPGMTTIIGMSESVDEDLSVGTEPGADTGNVAVGLSFFGASAQVLRKRLRQATTSVPPEIAAEWPETRTPSSAVLAGGRGMSSSVAVVRRPAEIGRSIEQVVEYQTLASCIYTCVFAFRQGHWPILRLILNSGEFFRQNQRRWCVRRRPVSGSANLVMSVSPLLVLSVQKIRVIKNCFSSQTTTWLRETDKPFVPNPEFRSRPDLDVKVKI